MPRTQGQSKKVRRGRAPEPAPAPRFPEGTPQHWALAAILCAAFGLRIYNLESIPIAGDESGYLRWAEIVVHQRQWFISLLDGKQPLGTWLQAAARVMLADNPLFGARLVSVVAGSLSTLGIFAIGRRLGGDWAGFLAAILYAVFPYALLYDRLAYMESLVNLSGVVVVYTSITHFDDTGGKWTRALVPGVALGLGFFAKSTAVLFAFFPVAAGLWLARGRPQRLLLRLAVLYGVALLFPLVARVATPRAPMMQSHSLIVHQTSFFVAPAELLRNPFVVAPANVRQLGEYVGAYMTWPLAIAALAAAFYLGNRRSEAVMIVFAACWAPLLVQVFILQKLFPTRYPFPHLWPALVILAMGAARLRSRLRPALTLLVVAAVAGPAVFQAFGVVQHPAEHLYAEDARMFLGSGPSAGFGIREAAEYLRAEARQGPLTVFTDAIWGSPADAMFIYLNERYGIRAYEAWWTSLGPNYPILPAAPVEILKSQSEWVAAGTLDPAKLGRVYYVTETAYNPPAAVRLRQPGARLLVSFPKPNGRNSIDVYRLR